MKSKFYDVKTRTSVEAEVVEKKTFLTKGVSRYAFVGKTGDGRTLIRFVSKEDYESAKV